MINKLLNKNKITNNLIFVGLSFFIFSINPLTLGFVNVFSEDNEKDLDKYDDIEELAEAIDDNKFDDDDINWKDFKSTAIYKEADDETQDCIEDAAELGNNLSDYEILDCYDEYD